MSVTRQKRGNVHQQIGLEANKGASHTTCIHLFTGVIPAVIHSKSANTERNEFVVEVVEVDVLAMVVVHVGGS